jgi:hypothetical protein
LLALGHARPDPLARVVVAESIDLGGDQEAVRQPAAIRDRLADPQLSPAPYPFEVSIQRSGPSNARSMTATASSRLTSYPNTSGMLASSAPPAQTADTVSPVDPSGRSQSSVEGSVTRTSFREGGRSGPQPANSFKYRPPTGGWHLKEQVGAEVRCG